VEDVECTSNNVWLVVWNMAFIFPYIGNVIIPTDKLLNHQPDVGFSSQQLWPVKPAKISVAALG